MNASRVMWANRRVKARIHTLERYVSTKIPLASVFCATMFCMVAAIPTTGAAGLTERPLNLTCVAPPRPATSFALEAVATYDAMSPATAAGVDNGVLYRGREASGLQGLYLYINHSDNTLMARAFVSEHAFADRVVLAPKVRLLGAGEGDNGDLLLSTSAGVQRLVREGAPLPESFPATLTATGCVDPADASQPAVGLIPYAPSAPLWTDGAVKRRWIAMPDWLTPDTKIGLLPDGDFDFPIGTVLVKEFALGSLRVETRLLVRHSDGEWAGYSYEWNDQQTDALLLDGFKVKEIAGQTWTFPSRGECTFCHSAASNRTLGPETAQLNHDYDYGAHGVANQLSTLDAIGMFDGGLPAPPAQLDALPAYDAVAPLSDRARGYLHANCAMCHRPGGPGAGPEDFRYYLDGQSIGALDVDPTRGNLGVPNAKLLKRGVPEESVLWLRLASNSFRRMPPIGVSIVDDQAVALVGDWIRSGSGFGYSDGDDDEYSDDLDNCSAYPNADQRDTDGDGFGNACDADFNNDNIVNAVDLGILRARFFSNDPEADLNGDGVVNAADLGRFRALFFSAPGPGAAPL